jgi:acylphosphatase
VIQRRVFVSGLVQGVSFRAGVVHEAARFPGLRGWVRNLPDGRVEAVFAGEQDAVLAMAAWCGHGPSAARVTDLEVREEAVDPALGGFGVVRL